MVARCADPAATTFSEVPALPTERDSTAPEPAIESGERAAREAAGVHDSPAPPKDHHDTFPAASEPTVAEGTIGNFYFKRATAGMGFCWALCYYAGPAIPDAA
jgi:hypothetical protein